LTKKRFGGEREKDEEKNKNEEERRREVWEEDVQSQGEQLSEW